MDHFYQNIQGWFDFENFYSEIVSKLPNNSHIVEVGSWKGKSSAFIAVEIFNSKKVIKFDCVDTWTGSEEHQNEQDINKIFEIFCENMKLVEGHFNAIRLPSIEAAKLYENESLDFVFIDAAHDYDNVCADINAWLPKVKLGGILGGHDYFHPPVEAAVQDMLKEFNPLPYYPSSWYVRKN